MADFLRYYIVINLSAVDDKERVDLQQFYRAENHDALRGWIIKAADLARSFESAFEVTNGPLPSNHVRSFPSVPGEQPLPEELVIPLTIDADETNNWLQKIAEPIRSMKSFLGGGADIPFAGTEHWCPRDAADPIFSDRSAAEALLRVKTLRANGLTGKNVNVVVADQGLDMSRLGNNYADGWSVFATNPGMTTHTPGSTRRTHGMMIAQNIINIAPEVRLFDLPMVPPWKDDIPTFLGIAQAAYIKMLQDIPLTMAPRFPGPWIIVNPWGIFDTKTDLSFPYDYAGNPNHYFNIKVGEAVNAGIDVVFAAGNCGQFCPDRRCGARDKGPGHSILGANSHPKVLTVGAVRSDEMWIGYSSQGPGQSGLDTTAATPNPAEQKPDLCAPSQFHEDGDAFTVNTGTSAACAIATGVVAALRTKWNNASVVSPAALKAALISTTLKHSAAGWDDRLGHGILNAEAAYLKLKTLFP